MTDETDGGLPSAAVSTGLLASAVLSACGGGTSDESAEVQGEGRARPSAVPVVFDTPVTPFNTWRFLNQASMGPTNALAAEVENVGYSAWLNAQFARAVPVEETYDYNYAANSKINGERLAMLDLQVSPRLWKYGSREDYANITGVWWERAISSPDQLRQRIVFALSQILVISLENGFLSDSPRSVAGFLDLLSNHAFGSYRDLIESVCKSPAMGIYLTHFGNQKAQANPQRIPDQNFARELLQLFTLGLNELNPDGSPVLGTNGKPIPTFGKEDVATLSHMLTGWAMPVDSDPALMKPYDHYFQNRVVSEGPLRENGLGFGAMPKYSSDWRWVTSMHGFPAYHAVPGDLPVGELKVLKSTEPLLGVSPQESLTKALDLIFQHKNLAPFIAKQMIQRLVTSNPSGVYVQDVATQFKENNWSMQALIKAILLHPQARDAAVASGVTYGKLREPVLRVTHMLRLYGVVPSSTFDKYVGADTWGATAKRLLPTEKPLKTINAFGFYQAPMMAPSVFNFYTPDFRLPLQATGEAVLFAPEMKLVTDSSAAGYINAIYDILDGGFRDAYSGKISVDISSLVSRAMSSASPTGAATVLSSILRGQLLGTSGSSSIRNVLSAVCKPVNLTDTAEVTSRIKAAILLIMCSPEYITQK